MPADGTIVEGEADVDVDESMITGESCAVHRGVGDSVVAGTGVSDFHALSASASGILGFDGALRMTPNGVDWTSLDSTLAPFALAISPSGQTMLATTPEAVMRSVDGGSTCGEEVPSVPPSGVMAVVTSEGLLESVDGGGKFSAR